MRSVLVSLFCAIVVGMMLAVPVSAGSKMATFTDREGDLGNKSLFAWLQGSHELGDPNGWASGESPIALAGYVDMLYGWVEVSGATVTMGLMVNSPLPVDGKLPQGISEVRWAWLFWTTIETTVASNSGAYGVYIVWNENGLSAVLVDRTSGFPPFLLKPLDTFAIDGNVLTVSMSAKSISGAVAWFCETQALSGPPWPLDQPPAWGGWTFPDITDYQGPLAVYWPWIAMP